MIRVVYVGGVGGRSNARVGSFEFQILIDRMDAAPPRPLDE
jgi:hypothetical protein